MRLSAQDEYGLRLLLRIAKAESADGLTTGELAALEGISMSHAGKLLRVLRLGGFIESTRGNRGGYNLTRNPEEIAVADVLAALGGRLYDDDFCNQLSPGERLCTMSVDCSVRSLWRMIQWQLDRILADVSLQHLLAEEHENGLMLKG